MQVCLQKYLTESIIHRILWEETLALAIHVSLTLHLTLEFINKHTRGLWGVSVLIYYGRGSWNSVLKEPFEDFIIINTAGYHTRSMISESPGTEPRNHSTDDYIVGSVQSTVWGTLPCVIFQWKLPSSGLWSLSLEEARSHVHNNTSHLLDHSSYP